MFYKLDGQEVKLQQPLGDSSLTSLWLPVTYDGLRLKQSVKSKSGVMKHGIVTQKGM